MGLERETKEGNHRRRKKEEYMMIICAAEMEDFPHKINIVAPSKTTVLKTAIWRQTRKATR